MEIKDSISGPVFVLGDNIDTDQILTAEFMKINPSTPDGYKELGALALCGLPQGNDEFINRETGRAYFPIIVAGKNFGCGSSREHAPVALGASGVKVVVAQSFARIFYRNCITTGELIPVELDYRLADQLHTGDTLTIDIANNIIQSHVLDSALTPKPIGALADFVAEGGLFAYARANGIIS